MASTNPNPLKRKYKSLTIEMKMKLLQDVDQKIMPKKAIAEKYGIPANTLSTIVKNRKNVEELASSTANGNKKRMRLSNVEDVDSGLLEWFKQARAQCAPISGPILMEKAEVLAKEMGVEFTPSAGWLDRFKKRHGIVYRTINGEAAAVDQSTVEEWSKTALLDVLKEFGPCDIFNADETGIFFKCLPDKTFDFKGSTCTGGKKAKERLTVLVATNMSGTEKLPLYVIGKSAKPRCFSNIKKLPVDYTANSKAWMTATLFEAWVRKMDRKFQLQGRTIALLIDNCPAHPTMTDLKAIKLVFLPPNCTAKIQPCDQGIINCFKRHYRKSVVQRYLVHVDTGSAKTFNISVLDCLYMMRKAWEDVSSNTIANCFRHAGFRHEALNEGSEKLPQEQETVTTAAPTSDTASDNLGGLFNRLKNIIPMETTLDAFLNIDSDVPTTEAASVRAIAECLKGSGSDEQETDDDDDDGEEETIPTSSKEARAALLTLKKYTQEQAVVELMDDICSFEFKFETHITNKSKQTLITSFFKK